MMIGLRNFSQRNFVVAESAPLPPYSAEIWSLTFRTEEHNLGPRSCERSTLSMTFTIDLNHGLPRSCFVLRFLAMRKNHAAFASAFRFSSRLEFFKASWHSCSWDNQRFK